MSTPLSLIASGSFTSTGAARTIEFPTKIDYFRVRNRSTYGTNPNLRVESEWSRGYAAGQSTGILESGAGVLTAAVDAAGGNGFAEIDQSTLTDGALVATGTAISQAAGAIVTDANNPAIGDIVRLYNTTGMFQVASMDFSVTAINAGVSYTLGYLDSSGFAAAATNADYRVINPARYSPEKRYITAITAANPAVITLSVTHQYTVGDIISIRIPNGWGMTQMNGLTAIITAINTATNTITTDIDSSAFTAFAFPTSAVAAAGISFPMVLPVGEIATQLDQYVENTSYFGLRLGSSVVGANTNVMDWFAYARDYTV